MGTSEYRKISDLEKINPYPFAVCSLCKEVFINDTFEPKIYCPVHKNLMRFFETAEGAERSLTPIGWRDVLETKDGYMLLENPLGL